MNITYESFKLKIRNRANHSSSNSHNNSGFTLIELLIAMVIFGIIVALIIGEYSDRQGRSITQQQAVEIQQTARASLYLISTEIIQAGYDPLKKGDVGIITAGNGSTNPLRFSYYDSAMIRVSKSYQLADNGSDGDNDITMKYGKESSPGAGIIEGGSQLLAENISALTFSYLDENNAATTVLDDIRAIQMTITATTDANERDRTQGSNNARTLITTIKCRNMGL